MNRNLIFVFILFAIFSIVNAIPHQFRKREITFYECGNSDALGVIVLPNPPVSEQPVTYTVSSTLSNDITAGKTILEIVYFVNEESPEQYLEEPFTQVFTDSYGAGTPFSTTAKDVPTPNLPKSYRIFVLIGDPTGNPKKPLDLYGCQFAPVGETSGEKAYPIAGYPIEEFSYPIAERLLSVPKWFNILHILI